MYMQFAEQRSSKQAMRTLPYTVPISGAQYDELYSTKVVVLPDDHDFALPDNVEALVEGPVIHQIAERAETGAWGVERGTIW